MQSIEVLSVSGREYGVDQIRLCEVPRWSWEGSWEVGSRQECVSALEHPSKLIQGCSLVKYVYMK